MMVFSLFKKSEKKMKKTIADIIITIGIFATIYAIWIIASIFPEI